MTSVKIPTPLRKFTNNIGDVEIDGDTVKELIDNLDKKYPGIKQRLCDENGTIRKYINIYVGDEDIRFLQGEKTKIENNKEVIIVPAIAGG